jgi:ribosomal protein S18 acetylase RimI-like enzyme
MNVSVATAVRRATQADADSLARLRLEFRGPRAPNVESEREFLARCTKWMGERLAPTSPWRAWTIERNGGAAGAIWMQIVEKLPNPATESEVHAYITNFYVRPESRNDGVGSALLAAALSECEQLAVDSVFLWPTERSRSLYARYGFASSDDVLVLKR